MAAANLGEAVLSLRTDSTGLSTGMDQAQGVAENKLAAMGAKFAQAGANLTQYITLPFLGIAAASIKVASDAEETASMFDAVFKAQAGSVRAWADETAAALNRSSTDLEGYLATFQDTFVPLGFARDEAAKLSQQLTTLGIDLASFKNMAEPDVINNLTSALVGNHEAVRSFGIIITQATLDAELFRMGIAGGSKEATEQEKVLARLNLIMASTTDAQGDAARTAEGFANQMRGAWAGVTELGIAIGAILIPPILTATPYVMDAVNAFKGLDPSLQTAIVGLAAFAAAAGPLLVAVGALTVAISAISTPVLAVFGASGAIAVAIAALVSFGGSNDEIGKLIDEVWQDIVVMFDDVFADLQAAYADASAAWMAIWNKYGEEITAAFKVAWVIVKTIIDEALILIESVLSGGFQTIGGLFKVFAGVLTGDWTMFTDGLKGIWDGMWTAIVGIVTAPMEAVKKNIAGFTTATGDYFDALYDRVVGNSSVPDLIDGIRDEFGRLPNVMTLKAQTETELTSGLFGTLETDVSKDIGNLASAVSTGFGGLGAAMTTPAEREAAKVETAFSDMKADVDRSLSGLLSSIGEAFGGNGIGGLVKSLGGILSGGFNGDSLKNLGLNFAKNAVGAIPVVGPLLQSVFDPLADLIGGQFGKGRKAADKLVGTEDQFWQGLTNFLPSDQVSALSALPAEQAARLFEELTKYNSEYVAAVNQFATQGGNEAKVASQSLANTQPHVQKWLAALQTASSQTQQIDEAVASVTDSVNQSFNDVDFASLNMALKQQLDSIAVDLLTLDKQAAQLTQQLSDSVEETPSQRLAIENELMRIADRAESLQREQREIKQEVNIVIEGGVYADDSTIAKLAEAISRAVRNDGVTLISSEQLA